jgi:hypothetical protein
MSSIIAMLTAYQCALIIAVEMASATILPLRPLLFVLALVTSPETVATFVSLDISA